MSDESDPIEAITLQREEGGMRAEFPARAEFSPECFRYADQLGMRLTLSDDFGNQCTYRIAGFTNQLNLVLEKETSSHGGS